MNSLNLPPKVEFSHLYLCTIKDLVKSSEEIVDFVGELNNNGDCLLGFDRTLWASLSSGQMPSQLYTFNFYGSPNSCEVHEGVLAIFSKSEITIFPNCLNVNTINLNELSYDEGEMVDSFEEDDEFENCNYATLLNWKKYTEDQIELKGLKNLWFDHSIQLLIGKSLYVQDDWVDSFFNDEAFNTENEIDFAVHLLLPCQEKIEYLKEAVKDKERIHLDPEIKGIYC